MSWTCSCIECMGSVAEPGPEPDWLRGALLGAIRRHDFEFAWRALDLLGGLMGEW